MDLKLLALLLLPLLTVEAQVLEACPCPGGGCACLDSLSCAPANASVPWSCSNPGKVCCRPRDPVGEVKRTGNDVFLDQCGLATPQSAHPWSVSIYLWLEDPYNNYVRLCPGVLIHPQVVLTSANCTPHVEDDGEMLVYAGEGLDVQTRLVTKLGYHDYFDESTGDFDIALLYVDKPFVLGDAVRVICMPQRGKPLDTRRCFSMRRNIDTGRQQETRVDLQEYVEDCVQNLPRETQERYALRDFSMFCAISRDADSLCESDEGSSMVCPLASAPERAAVGGVVSVALGCSDASQPIFYTNTTYFATWLQVKLALLQLDNFAIPPQS